MVKVIVAVSSLYLSNEPTFAMLRSKFVDNVTNTWIRRGLYHAMCQSPESNTKLFPTPQIITRLV